MIYNICHRPPQQAWQTYLHTEVLIMEFEKIREVLIAQFGVDSSAIKPETAFVDDLGADSLDVVELIMAIEEAFDIEIPDTEAENIATVQDAVEYLKNHN